MAKAINWPEQFLDEVLNENSTDLKIALRIGSLYFDNNYYSNNEIVDIRVDHKVIRKARIIEEMKLIKIKEIDEAIISKYKNSLQNKDNIVSFLKSNYNVPVDENTFVTVVTYKNLPVEKTDSVDDPHL